MIKISEKIEPKIYPKVFSKVSDGTMGVSIGGGGVLPPDQDELLVWLKGNSTDTEKLDSWKKPDAENFTMSQSHCIALNGVNEFGNAGVISSPTTLRMNVAFISDDISVNRSPLGRWHGNDSIRINAGGSILIRVGGTEVSTGITVVLGDYYYVESYWDGASLVASVNGVEVINQALSGTLNDDKDWYLGEQGEGGNFFEGKIFNATLNDTHFRMAEGSGLTSFSDDYDTDGHMISWTGVEANLWAHRQDYYHGNAIGGWWEIDLDEVKYPYAVTAFDTYHIGGTFNYAETSFAPEDVGGGLAAQSIIDMEAVQGLTHLTDGLGHALPMTQAEWEELGAERVYNGEFVYGDDGWGLDAEWTIANGRAIANTTATRALYKSDGLSFEAGKTYKFSFYVYKLTGKLEVKGNAGVNIFGGIVENTGYHESVFVNDTSVNLRIYTNGAATAEIDHVSVREVNPVINTNKQYYFCPTVGLWLYDRVLTEAEHLENVEFMYNQCTQEHEALINEETGNIIYNEETGNIVYDEEA